MSLKPLITEKAVMKIEMENLLTFIAPKETTKNKIKKQVEEMFKVKVDNVRTLIRDKKKFAYVKLNKKNPAMDVATKLGMI